MRRAGLVKAATCHTTPMFRGTAGLGRLSGSCPGQRPFPSHSRHRIGAQLLPITEEVEAIAQIYIDKMIMPKDPQGDALHLAAASFYRVEILLNSTPRLPSPTLLPTRLQELGSPFMNTEKVIAGYLRVASEDLQGAIALAEMPNRNAIYLCSQAAEKVIRAVLTSEGKHAGTGHQLDRMAGIVPDQPLP